MMTITYSLLTETIIGTIATVPLLISSIALIFIVLIAVLPISVIGIGIGTIIIALTLGLGVLPLLLVLHFLPSPLHMMSTGYTSLLTCKARLVTGSGKMRRLDSVLTSAEENNDIPVLSIVNDLCYLSNIAYMLSDFRKMCILGKLPVHFKHIELECDKMNQWDLIAGKPHELKAFQPNGETGTGGIRPSILNIFVLREVVRESVRVKSADSASIIGTCGVKRQSIQAKANKRMSSISCDLDGSTRRRSSLFMTSKSHGGKRQSILAKAKRMSSKIFASQKELSEKNLRGWDVFDDQFEQAVMGHCHSCHKGEPGGAICERTGFHGVQHFLDKLVRMAKQGDTNCEELLDMLYAEDLPDDLAKMHELLFNIASRGNVFTEHYNKVFMAMYWNDSRIVWTNDRASDSELVYAISVSKNKRRVDVIFRGTATSNDVLKDLDPGVSVVQNPIKGDYPGKTDSIELHRGFAEYLFEKRMDTGRSKFDEILQRVKEYGEEVRVDGGGYSLYISGHSLGGSLAQIFGFYASLDDDLAKRGNPVRVFTFASAISGRISFAKAFQHHEQKGLIQHLRISNDHDVIPLAHYPHHFNLAQTGISLCLHACGKLPSVKYVKDLDWWSTLKANIYTNFLLNIPWFNLSSAAVNHGVSEHVRRIEMAEATMVEHGLENVTLNDLYATYVHEVQDEDTTVSTSEDEKDELLMSMKMEPKKSSQREQESIPDEISISAAARSTNVDAAETSDGSISNSHTSKYHRLGSVDSC